MPGAEPLRYDSLMVMRGLDVGFLLDRQWHALRGEMETTKRPALIALAGVLEDTGTPYAIIGGVAVQVHRAEPRTTLDIDLAVPSLEAIPRAKLLEAGFTPGGHFAHSENWVGPEGVPVQFTDDPALAPALERALEIDLDGVRVRVIGRSDLLHEKLGSGSDPALRMELSEAERAVLDSLPE